ncbi:hypothetical protein KFE26_19245 [Shewanella sp. M16]|uniref:hypothetical protein n=1 Tax=Shewanella sp. M16 TaxID=2830837 RepID=UPI001BAFC17E|nr:hypothetical protein [Shewanella sp. M16]MBS0044420.1 hypothetical protein [Shewanella sp. M16]
MLDRIHVCSDLVSTAINAIEKNDQATALANLHGLKNIINGLKFGDQITAKAIKQVAKNTGLEDAEALEALVLAGCTTFGRGHGLKQSTLADFLLREANIAKNVTLPILGVK